MGARIFAPNIREWHLPVRAGVTGELWEGSSGGICWETLKLTSEPGRGLRNGFVGYPPAVVERRVIGSYGGRHHQRQINQSLSPSLQGKLRGR